MTDIYLIRHGQCKANVNGIVSGPLDDSLTEEGIRQVNKLQKILMQRNIQFDTLYTSTAKRAIDTAKILAPNLTPIKVASLLEINTGMIEKNCDGKKSIQLQDYIELPFPQGESYLDLYQRSVTWFEKLVYGDNEQIAVVAHGGSLAAIIHHVIGDVQLEKFPLFELSNASLTHIIILPMRRNYFFKCINFHSDDVSYKPR